MFHFGLLDKREIRQTMGKSEEKRRGIRVERTSRRDERASVTRPRSKWLHLLVLVVTPIPDANL